jgi:hypothetical protein
LDLGQKLETLDRRTTTRKAPNATPPRAPIEPPANPLFPPVPPYPPKTSTLCPLL